ncbi:MAG: hypothetical protein ACJ75H_19195 [Thermoanaerobaculia bacterium]
MVRTRGESGYALVMALLVIFLVSVSLALLAASLQIRLRLEAENGETVILSGLSDGALAETLANLAEDRFYTGLPEHDFGKGRISSTVESLDAESRLFSVRATATYRQRRRVVEARVVRGIGSARVVRWRRVVEAVEKAEAED